MMENPPARRSALMVPVSSLMYAASRERLIGVLARLLDVGDGTPRAVDLPRTRNRRLHARRHLEAQVERHVRVLGRGDDDAPDVTEPPERMRGEDAVDR